MNRRVFRGLVAICAAGFIAGCGGKVEPLFEGETDGPNRPNAAESGKRVWFETKNEIEVNGRARARFDLVQGGEVQIMVVTRDGSPLAVDLLRMRKDGSEELIAPVTSQSGFYLSTFKASGGGHQLRFASDERQTVVISLECKSGEGTCAPAHQPGEHCTPWNTCDEGLACEPYERVGCGPAGATGRCSAAPARACK